ncbi:hypothetical protein [Herbaspirillum huttiense]|uniref:hypothetical protein n=1 Tax=Herbaspirillum huttiense TaxID=863372 RepID=UPI0039B0E492
MKYLRQSLTAALLGITLLLLSGCASVIYKDAATTYTVAAHKLITQLNSLADASAKAEDMRRKQIIISDQQCPIGQQRIFVRYGPSAIFSSYVEMFPTLAAGPDCKALVACDSKPGSAECSNGCYSQAQATCLINLEGALAAERARAVSPNTLVETRYLGLAKLLDQIEYGRVTSISSKVTADSIKALTEYLDLLEKASSASKSDLESQVKATADRIGKVSAGYEKLSGEKISTSDAATLSSVTASLGALSKLADDLKIMRDNAKDADAIKATVIKTKTDVNGLISSLRQTSEADLLLSQTQFNISVANARGQIEDSYRATGDPVKRSELLDQALTLKRNSGESASQSLNAVFDSLSKSHEQLVELITNPSLDNKAAARNEEFQQFKKVAEDSAGVVSQLAAFF